MTRAVAFIDQDTSVAIAANTLCVIEGTSTTDAYTLRPTVVTVNPTTGVITGASMPGEDGTVTNVSSATADITVADPTTTPELELVSVGGETVADVAQATVDALAATNANTVSTIVKRDASGDFTAGTITAATGLVATTGGVTATAGNMTATDGNMVFGTAGNKVIMPMATTTTAGANSAGTVTLVGGTATIATTAVTANSKIILSRQGVGATGAAALGILTTGTVTPDTSFEINSVQAADATALQASDVSVVYWEIKDSA